MQAAIDASSTGDRVLICEGTYTEQLVVDESVSLIGAGPLSVIKSPLSASVVDRYNLPPALPGAFPQFQPVVWVNADGVTVQDLTVDGDHQGNVNGNHLFTGISGFNRDGLEVRGTTVTGIQKTPFDGVQTGYAIRLDNTDGATRSAVIDANELVDYQKGGIVIRGLGLDGTITGNVITGVGQQTDIAQNGISFGRGMSGLIEGNTITAHQCNQASCGPNISSQSQSAGLIMVASFASGGDVTVRDNVFGTNDVGVLSSVSDGSSRTVETNIFTDNRYEGLYTEDGVMEAAGNTITGGNTGVMALSGAGGFVPTLHLFGNTITQAGDGIELVQNGGGANPAPVVTADHNRIVGNTTAGVDNGSTVPMDAENNWWGCNEGPNQPGCDSTAGLVDFDPWLVLGLNAAPATLEPGQTSDLTASLQDNSDGIDVGPGFPDGNTVDFTTDFGTLTAASDDTVSGEALTGLDSAAQGVANVTAELDNASAGAQVTFSDTDPPSISIDSGPRHYTNSSDATMTFSSDDPTATFRCRLTEANFAPCTSPKIYAGLAEGTYDFRVYATDPYGNKSPGKKYTWTVDQTPPIVTIDSGPSGIVSSHTAEFAFSANESLVTFGCRIDGGTLDPCTSPKVYNGVANGFHRFTVRGRDRAGNISVAVQQTWRVQVP